MPPPPPPRRAVSIATLAALATLLQTPAAPLPTPPPVPAPAPGPAIVEGFLRLSRASSWHPGTHVRLAFPTHHPQGMSFVGDRFFLSSVEVHDRARERGIGHLFEVDLEGRLLRQRQLGHAPFYHPGGIDHDGHWLWVPVAEYRPDSRSLVYRVDPATLEATLAFEFADHLGAVVCDPARRRLVAVSWGSRRIYRWDLAPEGLAPLDPAAPTRVEHGSHYVDFQDGQSLPGTGLALFGGVSRLPAADSRSYPLGGLELLELETLRAIRQLPLPLHTARGQSLLQNPMAVRPAPSGLEWFFIPEDDPSTLYRFTTD